MLKSIEEEKQTLDKTNSNENDLQINLSAKDTLLSAISQSQTQQNKTSENYDLTKEQNSSSGEWGEDKSEPNNKLIGKKKSRPMENSSKPRKTIPLKELDDSISEEKEKPMYNNINNMNNIPNPNLSYNYNNEFEKEVLIKLVNREGFPKVFNVLSKPCLDRKNPLEKKLDEIISNIGLLRTSLILLQIKFDQNQIPCYRPAYNPPPYYMVPPPQNPYLQNSNNGNPYLNQSNMSYNNNYNNNYNSVNSTYEDHDVDNILEENKEYKRATEESKYKRVQERKQIENEGYELGEHLHKESDGKVYKYLKHHLRVTKGYVFNCADRKCKSKGLYDVDNMNFKIIHKHTLSYEQHNYIMNKDKFNQYKTIFDDFIKRECNEAQVFKNEAGNKLVKWYNN